MKILEFKLGTLEIEFSLKKKKENQNVNYIFSPSFKLLSIFFLFRIFHYFLSVQSSTILCVRCSKLNRYLIPSDSKIGTQKFYYKIKIFNRRTNDQYECPW